MVYRWRRTQSEGKKLLEYFVYYERWKRRIHIAKFFFSFQFRFNITRIHFKLTGIVNTHTPIESNKYRFNAINNKKRIISHIPNVGPWTSILRHLKFRVSACWCAMKKILSKFEKNERTDNSNSSGAHQREASCFIGKVFTVGRTVVTVEDVLAEG